MKTKPRKHGGKRAGAGLTALYGEAMDRYTVRLTVEQAATAKAAGNGDMAAGIRAVLDAARK